MADHRYSTMSVAQVRDGAAREYLSAVGLPREHVLFSPVEGVGPVRFEGRDLLRLGSGGDGDDAYCVDCDTGEVFYVGDGGVSPLFVNSSPQHFGESLRLFDQATAVSAESDLEAIADSLGSALAAHDPSAMEDDQGYWGSVLFDVASGDYVEDSS